MLDFTRIPDRGVGDALGQFGGLLRADEMGADALAHSMSVQAAGRLRVDAGTIPVFAQDLEDEFAQIMEAKHPALLAANGDVVPIVGSVDEGAETYAWREIDVTGFAASVDAYSVGDIPVVNIIGAKHVRRVVSRAVSWVYTVQDMRAERLRNRNVRSTLNIQDLGRKGMTRAIDQGFQTQLLFGNTEVGLEGILTNPLVPIYVFPAGVSGFTEWEQKTADEIVADVALLVDGPDEATNGMEEVDRVFLPRTKFNYIRRTPMGDNKDRTILGYLQENFPGITFAPLNELAADKSDFLEHDIALALRRDPEVCVGVKPMNLVIYAPQLEGLTWRVYAEERHGGVACPHPLAMAVGAGL